MGFKQEIYKDGKLVKTIDTRTLEGEKARILVELKERYNAEILAVYPQHKQNNAALGILPANEIAAMKNIIRDVVDDYEQRKAEIVAAETLSALEGV